MSKRMLCWAGILTFTGGGLIYGAVGGEPKLTSLRKAQNTKTEHQISERGTSSTMPLGHAPRRQIHVPISSQGEPPNRPNGQTIPEKGHPLTFRAFAVKDELKLSKDKKAAKPAGAAEAEQPQVAVTSTQPAAKPARPAAKALKLTLKPGQSVEDAWDVYFASHKNPAPLPAAVRATARELVDRKDFKQAVAFFQAALRNGQGQPWMFEGLGLTMQAVGYDRDEIERTLLSAVDFSGAVVDKLYVAHYLANTGFDARALKLYQQIAKAEPSRPEPYLQGLAAASRLNDIAGIQWATVGIVSQAWPDKQVPLAENALRKAKAAIEQLRSEDRMDEAEAFQAALNMALQRDLIVFVRWSGDADVDLTVEEPSGAVCSLRNPRTTGGGVLMNDSLPTTGDSSEVYICPRGFNGSYRMLIRKVWGKLPTGSVTLEVCTNYGTDKETWKHQQFQVGDRDIVVTFDLEGGRRQEQIAEQQLLQAAADQIALGQDVLFRKLQSVSSSSAMRELAVARQDTAVARQIIGRRGAVGYMPVITVLPQGANMQVRQAVISPDRRYVRVTPAPFFSTITQVSTFTFSGASGSTGAGPNQQPPGGGGGGGIGGGGGFF